jgi:hypothetical protein
MGRRPIFLVFAFVGLLLVGFATGVARGASSFVAASPRPAQPSPTASDPNEPSPDYGLGNTRASIERALGNPTGLKGTMIAYQGGNLAISYQDGRASGVLIAIPRTSCTLDAARQKVQAVLPADRVLVGTMEAGAHRVADVYDSARLGTFAAPPATTATRGQFVVIYEDDGNGSIQDALLLVGDLPKS